MSFFSYKPATETPSDPPPGSPMTRADWLKLSPGYRREIWRAHARVESHRPDLCRQYEESRHA